MKQFLIAVSYSILVALPAFSQQWQPQQWSIHNFAYFMYAESTIGIVSSSYYNAESGKSIITNVSITNKRIEFRFSQVTSFKGWWAPPGVAIEDVQFKSDDPTVLLILLSNGDVYISQGTEIIDNTDHLEWSTPEKHFDGVGSLTGSPGENKIAGDALYIISGRQVYVSRDTARTWIPDISGLGSSTNIYDIAIDTLNYGWLATSNGIFSQHPDSTGWIKNETFPGTNARAIHVDAGNRIIAGNSEIYISEDWGTTWDEIPGINASSTSHISSDEFGNIYSSGFSGSFRSDGGKAAWVNISDAIAEMAAPPNAFGYIDYTGIIRSLSAFDSVLYAATNWGFYESYDHGDSWSLSEYQLPTHKYYSLVSSGDYYLTSTRRGVFRVTKGDTVFTQVLPDEGFQSGIELFTDSTGTLFALVPSRNESFDRVVDNYISVDNGSTWARDTTGLNQFEINFRSNPYSVNDAGTQFISNNGGFWSKEINEPWKTDTLGMNFGSGDRVMEVSYNTRKDSIYALKRISFTIYELYSRHTGGTVWNKIDVSFFGENQLRLASNHDGNAIIYSRNMEMSIYGKDGWIPVTLPSTPELLYANRMSVDKNGTIWGNFISDETFKYRGVYFTENLGDSWEFAGLDGIEIQKLFSEGDTTFAITFNDGIYALSSKEWETPIFTEDHHTITGYHLYQNYPNPFNPTTTIQFSLGKTDHTTLIIYDALGRKVLTLLNEEKQAGNYSVHLDAKNLSSGVYFYVLESGNTQLSRKLILLK